MNYRIVISMFICCLLNFYSNAIGANKPRQALEYTHLLIKSDTTTEEIVIDKVYKLREVQAKDRYIDSLTHHKKGISLRVIEHPSIKKPYYWIQVGYDSDIRFEVYYNFYVYKKGLSIKYYDTFSGKVMELEQWRKRRARRE